MMFKNFNRYFIVLTFLWSVLGLYLLVFSDWFDMHKIWILNKFHLYIICIAWFISCIFSLRKFFLFNDHTFYIDSENSLEEKEKILNDLSAFYKLKIVEDGLYDKTYVDNQGQKIFIYYDESDYFITVKFSFFSISKNKKFLQKIGYKLTELVENKACP